MKNKKIWIFIIFLIIILLIGYFFISSNTLNKKAISYVKKYINSQNITINNTLYIKLNSLKEKNEFASCSDASGVLIKNNNGNYEFIDYLKCNNYSSKVNNDNIFKYDDLIIMNNDEEYYNNENIDVYNEEEINKDVKYIYYKQNNTIYKKVLLYTNDKSKNIDGSNNNLYPTITLTGDSIVNLYYNTPYNEPGYTAIDIVDGDITKNVLIDGEVNNKKIGSYVLLYRIFNSRGNYSTIKRTINIIKNIVNLNAEISLDNEKVTREVSIKLNISGDGYQKTILPNGEVSLSNEIIYKVNENNTYKFKIYDQNDEFIEKELVVSNIDTLAPKGVCSAIVRRNIVSISTSASDNNKIIKYKYKINEKEIENNETTLDYEGVFNKTMLPKVSLSVFDEAGNSTDINCSIVDKTNPLVYTDKNGYNCLEGYVCYKQRDYSDTYQATADGPGPISKNGCMPTSLSIISTFFNRKSSNGELFTPPTLVKEIIFPDGKIGGYSNYERIELVAEKLNLNVEKYSFNNNFEILKKELGKGNPAIINVSKGCLAKGGHYLAIIGINDNDEIFISDPDSKTINPHTEDSSCDIKVNTWYSINKINYRSGINYFAILSKK